MENGVSPYNHRETEREWLDRGCGWQSLPGGTAYEACPRDLLLDYGYEAVRLYEQFASRPVAGQHWEDGCMEGVYRFLARLWLFCIRQKGWAEPSPEGAALEREMRAQVSELWERGDGHGALAALMSWFKKMKSRGAEQPVEQGLTVTLLELLEPFAPAYCTALRGRIWGVQAPFTER